MSVRGLGVLAIASVAAWGTFRGSGAPVPVAPSAPAVAKAPPPPEPPRLARPLLEAHGYPALDGRVDVLVVTLPDPIASHLDWAFDSHLDGVRRAFERAGYLLDRFDLPWEPVEAGADPAPAGKPGVLLFRRRDGGADAKVPRFWVVYVVGELSTRGLDADAFDFALEDRRRVLDGYTPPADSARTDPAPAPVLRIVGPTFSGTSISLQQRLAAARDTWIHGEQVEVVSGAATSPSNARQIEHDGAGRVNFRTTVHTDTSFLAELTTLLDDFDIPEEHVAILQEGTTAYGGNLDTDARRYLVVPFPMSIGSLRRAATRGASTAPVSTGVALDSKAARTSLDLTEEPQRLETAGATTKLTPASIDLLLDETTRTLAQRGIQAALIFASDVRDKLFLGSELKKRLPDLQLFTFEGNVLYLRPEYNEWLRGMVVLSTYPLLLRDARWLAQSPPTPNENLLFANEGAEGTFNATLVQLGSPELVTDYTSGLQRRPTATADRPGIWATAVGATMMLPLAMAPPPPPPLSRPSADAVAAGVDVPLAATCAPVRPAGTDASDGKPISILILVWIALVTVGSAWVAWMDGRIHETGRRLRGVLPTERPDGKTATLAGLEEASLAIHHHMYRALLHFALLSLLLPLYALIAVDGPRASLNSTFAIVFLVAGIAVGAYFALRETKAALALAAWHTPGGIGFARRRPWRTNPDSRAWAVEILLRLAVALGSAGFVGLTVLLAGQIYQLDRDSAQRDLVLLFLHRTVEVDQGLSMLVPLAVIGLLAAAWARWHLIRLEGLSRPDPIDPVLDANGVPTGAVRAALFRVLPKPRSLILLFGLVPAAIWAWNCFGRTHDGALFQRLERLPCFDWLFMLGILGALLGSVWAAVRVLSIWSALREVLAAISGPAATLPFARLGESLGLRVSLGLWPALRGPEIHTTATTRWRLYGGAAAGRAASTDPKAETLPALDAEFVAGAPSDLTTRERERHLRVLVPAFLRRAPVRTDDVAAAEKRAEPPEAAVDEVLGTEIVLYLEGVVRQLRTLCFFLLVSVVLTTLLVNSYPFRPRELLQTASLFVFGGVIASLVWVIGSMNRNPTLSRATGSPPGELTWDRTLFTNLALYAIVPIVALVTSQKPELREMLFKWVEPLVRILVTA